MKNDRKIKELVQTNEKYIIDKAKQLYKINSDSYKYLGGFVNHIYEIPTDKQDYILRVNHSIKRDFESTEGEVQYIHYLAENGTPVSRPVVSINDTFTEKFEEENGYFVLTLFEKAPGRRLQKDEISEKIIHQIGRITGRMHKLSQEYIPSESRFKRHHWYEDIYLNSEEEFLVNDKELFDYKNGLIEKIKSVPRTKETYGLIHQDIHHGNYHSYNENIVVFDFDDSTYDYYTADLAVSLYYFLVSPYKDMKKREAEEFFLKHYLKGYEEENSLSVLDLYKLDNFARLRHILLYVILYDEAGERRWEFMELLHQYREQILSRKRIYDIDWKFFRDVYGILRK